MGLYFGAAPQVPGSRRNGCHGKAAEGVRARAATATTSTLYRWLGELRARGGGEGGGGQKAEQGRGLNASPGHVTGPSWRRPEAYPAPGSRL